MTVNQRFPGLDWTDCRAEVERELAARRRTYPDRVASGRMTATESDYQLAIFAAIAADVGRMSHIGPDRPEATHGFSWNERRAAIGRELDQRDRLYPEWIAGGRLQQDRADRQCLALRAILFRYDEGFDWRPTNGIRDQSAQDFIDGKPRTPQQLETWAEMDAIWRWPDGFFYQRWPDPSAAPAAPELALA